MKTRNKVIAGTVLTSIGAILYFRNNDALSTDNKNLVNAVSAISTTIGALFLGWAFNDRIEIIIANDKPKQ